MKALKGFSGIMSWIEEIMIVLLMTFMVSMNFINVVARKGFHASFSFTEELTIIAFVWVTMMGISAAYKRMAHLGMSFIVDKFPPKGQAVLALFGMVCSLILIAVMIVFGFSMVQGQIAMNATTPVLKLPAWVQGISIPVGGIFMCIRTLESSLQHAAKLWKGEPEEEGGVV